ncbi:MAG TPA: tyrosine-type recombinase/integrase [Symbiobacteriaceae bacterium]|jgi:integrase|nr:tyrosine-type recombinase/integrase [Symbiobacteriaceae bacterium]
MPPKKAAETVLYLDKFTSRKEKASPIGGSEVVPDSLVAWMNRYLQLVIRGVRSEAVTKKIALHLDRFAQFFTKAYGHDRISTCLRRDVAAWQAALIEDEMAPATVNNHLASLSGFTTWVHAQAPALFATGDPAKGIGEIGLPPLEPRALSDDQVRSLKNVCDRLERFHQLKGRRRGGKDETGTHALRRPWRDRAIVFVLLSTGLRREELVRLNLDQVEPSTPEELRRARKARIARVKGKGKTERVVFLSADARVALADYLEKERPQDGSDLTEAMFLSAKGLPARSSDGRLSPRSINAILEQIGKWHDAELRDTARHISPLRPHDLRHTFAFALARQTGADSYELERRLGHRSQRYIARYTNPPEDVAAKYVEEF